MVDNTYSFHGPGERWVEGEPTAVDLLNVARENGDHLHEALNSLIDTDNYLSGFVALWSDPVIFNAGASLFLALWLDNTDSADPIPRVKWGTNKDASPAAGTCRPASINDTTSMGIQLFSRNAGSPPP